LRERERFESFTGNLNLCCQVKKHPKMSKLSNFGQLLAKQFS
jgi:hypothetical protein